MTADGRTGNGGSSSSVKSVDLGILDMTSVFTNGPQTLYALQPGEALASVRFLDDVYEASDLNVNVPGGSFGIGTVKSFGWYGFAYVQSQNGAPPLVTDTFGLYVVVGVYGPDLGLANTNAMVLSAVGDVQAAWFQTAGDGTGVRELGITAWQAGTQYSALGAPDPGDMSPLRKRIIENGTVWYNGSASGTSGIAKPDFIGNAGGSVTDGADINWFDSTFPPITTGLVHAVAEIVTPT